MPDKPLPPVDPWTKPYWAGARESKLMLQFCPTCKKHIFYPRRYCPSCGSESLEWVESPGRGKVYAFTIVRNNAPSAFLPEMPYVVAVVRLSEGVQMLTNIVGCDPEQVRSEMPVEVVFKKVNEEITLPVFRPSRGQGPQT